MFHITINKYIRNMWVNTSNLSSILLSLGLYLTFVYILFYMCVCVFKDMFSSHCLCMYAFISVSECVRLQGYIPVVCMFFLCWSKQAICCLSNAVDFYLYFKGPKGRPSERQRKRKEKWSFSIISLRILFSSHPFNELSMNMNGIRDVFRHITSILGSALCS